MRCDRLFREEQVNHVGCGIFPLRQFEPRSVDIDQFMLPFRFTPANGLSYSNVTNHIYGLPLSSCLIITAAGDRTELLAFSKKSGQFITVRGPLRL